MESNATFISQLKSTDLFKDCDNEALKIISASCEQVRLQKNDILLKQGERSDALYIVIEGLVRITVKQHLEGEAELAKMGPGKILGEMHSWNADKCTASVYADQDTRLLKLSHTSFNSVVKHTPSLQLQLSNLVHQRFQQNELSVILTRIFGQTDAMALFCCADKMIWHQLKKGDYLFYEGTVGNSMFFIISGFLQVTKSDSRRSQSIIANRKRGDFVGEMAALSDRPRSASVRAVRDSEVVELPKQVLDQIFYRRPSILKTITNAVIDRLGSASNLYEQPSAIVNIAIIPIRPNGRLVEFINRLIAEISVFGSTMHWNSNRLDAHMNTPGISQTPKGGVQYKRVSQWLDEREVMHQFNVYETDDNVSPWTIRCLERADKIYCVAHSSDDPTLCEIERKLLAKGQQNASENILVLLHSDSDRLLSKTDQWLSTRQLKLHHHIRLKHDEDFKRLARFVVGRTIGLVLGGGGARGFAHIGVIRAIEEAGVPIDIIAGTSIGSLIAAQPCMNWDYQTMINNNKRFFVEQNPLGDYTFPFTSIVRGKKLDKYLKAGFQNLKIEDLWLTYFCVSSNLTTGETMVHQHGELWEAIRASISLPGVIPPVVNGNSLLIDGGIVNNLPGDIMRELFGGLIIAVDISDDTNSSIDYAEIPSPWYLLWNKICPFTKPVDAPNMLDILMCSTLLNSVNKKKEIKNNVANLYLQPPVSEFKILDFGPLERIAEAGFHYTKKQIDGPIAWALKAWASI